MSRLEVISQSINSDDLAGGRFLFASKLDSYFSALFLLKPTQLAFMVGWFSIVAPQFHHVCAE